MDVIPTEIRKIGEIRKIRKIGEIRKSLRQSLDDGRQVLRKRPGSQDAYGDRPIYPAPPAGE